MPRRRDVLRKLSSTGIAIGAMAGAAGARESPRNEFSNDIEHVEIRSEYDTPETVRQTFDTHSRDLRETLASEDLIGTTDVSSLDAFGDHAGENAIENVDAGPETFEDVVVMSTYDERTDTPTSVIRVTETFDGKTTRMFVLPEAGRSYAIVESDTGPNQLVDPTVQSMCRYIGTTTDCTNETCDRRDDCCWILGVGFCCTKEHHVIEEYEYYDCGGEKVKGDLVAKWCDNECCTEVGGTGCTDDCGGC